MQISMFFVALVWGFLLTFNPEYNEAVIFRMTNVICESYNQSWYIAYSCRLKAVRRHVTVLNINSSILHPTNNISVRGQVFKKANGYKPWLYNVTIDACRFLRRSYNPFMRLIFNLFKEFSNINHTCPYVGPQLVQGFYLRPELLILPIPTGDYLLEINWFFYNRPQFLTKVYFEFVENLGERN